MHPSQVQSGDSLDATTFSSALRAHRLPALRSWRDAILSELEAAHPNLHELTTRLDVRLIGHAMTRPTPGLVWGAARAAAIGSRPLGRVHFAHSDLSAMPIFEEAVYWGTRVAAEVALALPGKAF